MRKRTITTLAAGSILLTACAGFDDSSVRRTGTGAATGAAAGAIIGAFSGSPGTGAAIGATVGATGGYLYDQISKDQGRN